MTPAHAQLRIHNQRPSGFQGFTALTAQLLYCHGEKSVTALRVQQLNKTIQIQHFVKRAFKIPRNIKQLTWVCLKFPQHCFGMFWYHGQIFDIPSWSKCSKLLGSWTPAAHSQRCAVPNFNSEPRVVS